MKFIAKFLSVVFFPLFVPLYGLILLLSSPYFSPYPSIIIFYAYRSIFIFGIMVPLACIFLLYTFRLISDIWLEDKRDRFFPYLITALSYVFCSVLFFRMGMPLFVPSLLVGAAISLIVNAVISLWWKISAHMTGVGGLLGGILCVSYKLSINPYGWIILIVLICGLVACARLYLKAHTLGQVAVGFFNGLFWTLFIPGFSLAWMFLLFR